MHSTSQKIKDKNLKVTPQRIAIFHMLTNTTTHPNAEMIYSSLQETHPTMSLATVYKTLDTFLKAGLVQQLNVGEDAFRYDATVVPHSHIICSRCNRVDDMEIKNSQINQVQELRNQVECQTKYNISHEQLYFYGVCPECQ
ncbi:MAG: transcriptional repressor [Epulopiscium sp. Nele67-Bin005]|nr:MAG: transcriptional repressor [Epulopiscium sp. Nele67-Bin005]